MSRQIWLSFPLAVGGPVPPAIPAPELSPLYTVEEDGAGVQILKVATHTGTHVDLPRHVIAGGIGLTDLAVDKFTLTRPVVIDLPLGDATIVQPQELEPWKQRLALANVALFRFGYGAVRRDDGKRFSSQCPGFGVESARWLRQNCPDLRAMGLDVPSLSCIAHLERTMTAHNELLGGDGCRFFIVEDMNLEHDLTDLRELRVHPWLVQDMDSGPCSVVGILE